MATPTNKLRQCTMEFASNSIDSHSPVYLNCLICCSSEVSYPEKESSLSLLSPLFNLNAKKDCPSLGLQIDVIFTVCNLLDLPKSNVIELLSNHGNPNEWGVAYCKTCVEVIEKAKKVYLEIQKLQLHFESLKKTLRDEVVKSCQGIKDEVGETGPKDVKREGTFSYIRRGIYFCRKSKSKPKPQVKSMKSFLSRKMKVPKSTLWKFQPVEPDPLAVADDFLREISENKRNERADSITNQSEMELGEFCDISELQELVTEDEEKCFTETESNLPYVEASTENVFEEIAEENIVTFFNLKQEIEDDVETENYESPIDSNEFQEYNVDDYDPNFSLDIKSEADDDSYKEDSSEDIGDHDTDSDRLDFRVTKAKSVKRLEKSKNTSKPSKTRGRPRKNPPKDKKSKVAKRKSSPKPAPSKINKTGRRRVRGASSKRKVECLVCKKQIQFGSMNYHMKTHAEVPEYQCRGCQKRFTRKDYWELHEDIHIYNAFKLYNCCFCDAKVQGKSNYLNHLNETHETLLKSENSTSPWVQMAFFCDASNCKECFIKKEDFVCHLETHWKDGERLECSTCKKFFGNSSTMKKHEENHARLNETHNDCDFCSYSFEQQSDLDAHLAFHRVEFKIVQDNLCQECGKSYETLKRLKNHIYIQHKRNKDRYVEYNDVMKANSTTGQTSAWKRPKRIRRTFGSENYICKVCGENCLNRVALEKHCSALKHFSYQCNQCEKKYVTQKALHDHSFDHKSESFPCTDCSKVFTKPKNLYNHVRTQHSESKEKNTCQTCPHCPNRNYPHKASLDRHIVQNHRKTVDPENILHFCAVCYSPFRSEIDMTSHMEEKHRSKKCNFCGKFFFDTAKLKSHLRTHTGERPFPCRFCSKEFTQDINRVEHERTHTGERPFECTACGSKFLTKRLMKDHVKKLHPEVQ